MMSLMPNEGMAIRLAVGERTHLDVDPPLRRWA
jgi:hypothetical protein